MWRLQVIGSWQDLLSYNLIKHRDGHKEQNNGQPETRIMKVKENYQNAQRIVFTKASALSWQTIKNSIEDGIYFFGKGRYFEYRHCRCLARIMKNRNRFEWLLGVWTNPVYKTSWASLPAKQAVTVGFSLGFNVKLLHDCSHGNFDLPKLVPVERIFFLFSNIFIDNHIK